MKLTKKLQLTAKNLLKKYGQAITVNRQIDGYFYPESGETGNPTTSSFTGFGHPSPYTSQEIDNRVILSKDIRLLVKTDSEILVGDIIVMDSTEYRVMNVQKLMAQGESVVYRCQLRA